VISLLRLYCIYSLQPNCSCFCWKIVHTYRAFPVVMMHSQPGPAAVRTSLSSQSSAAAAAAANGASPSRVTKQPLARRVATTTGLAESVGQDTKNSDLLTAKDWQHKGMSSFSLSLSLSLELSRSCSPPPGSPGSHSPLTNTIPSTLPFSPSLPCSLSLLSTHPTRCL
jgi:hypothetical protein